MSNYRKIEATAKYGMVLGPNANESARKLAAWFKYMAWIIENNCVDQKYDGASDAQQGPCTVGGFLECCEDHVNNHQSYDSWSEEFCPLCFIPTSDTTADEYELLVENSKM
jgi:hypothetical protein